MYSDTRSAQWREMVRIGRFKQQENMQNFKNTIYLKFKFKLVLQMKQLNECPTKLQKLKRNQIQKSTVTQSYSNLNFLENILETEMQPITNKNS